MIFKYCLNDQFWDQLDTIKEDISSDRIKLELKITSQQTKLDELLHERSTSSTSVVETAELEAKLQSKQTELEELTKDYDTIKEDISSDRIKLELKITSQQTKLDELLHERSTSSTSVVETAELEAKLQSKQTELEELTKDYDTIKEDISSDRIKLELKITSQQTKLDELLHERSTSSTSVVETAELEAKLQSKQTELEELTKDYDTIKEDTSSNIYALELKITSQQTKLDKLLQERSSSSTSVVETAELEAKLQSKQTELDQLTWDYNLIRENTSSNIYALESKITSQQTKLDKLLQERSSSPDFTAEKAKLESKITSQQTKLDKLLQERSSSSTPTVETAELEEKLQSKQIELDQLTWNYNLIRENTSSNIYALESKITSQQTKLDKLLQERSSSSTPTAETAELEEKLQSKQIELDQLTWNYNLIRENTSSNIYALESKITSQQTKLDKLLQERSSSSTPTVETAELESKLQSKQIELDQLTWNYNLIRENTSSNIYALESKITSQQTKLDKLLQERSSSSTPTVETAELESKLQSKQIELDQLTWNYNLIRENTSSNIYALESKITSQQTKLDKLLQERSSSSTPTVETAELESKLQSKQSELEELTKDYDAIKANILSDRIKLESKIKSQQDKLEQASVERKELEQKLLQRSVDTTEQTLDIAKKKKSVFSKLFTKTDPESDRIIATSTLEEKIIDQQIKERESQNTLSASLKIQQIKLVKLIGEREEAERKAKILSPALEHQISYLERELEKFAQVSELAEKRALQTKANLESKIREAKEIESKSNLTMDLLTKQKDELEKTRLEREAKVSAVGDEELKLIAQIKYEKQQIRKLLDTQAQLKSHMIKNPDEVKQELKEIEEQIYNLIKRDAKKPLHQSIISALDELNHKLQHLLDDQLILKLSNTS